MAGVEQLIHDLTTGPAPGRLAAAEGLASLGPDAASAAAPLVAATGDAALRDTCVGALEELGPPPPEQAPQLAALMASTDESVAYWAATLLGRLGPAAAPHAADLERVAGNGAAPVAARERATQSLGKIGPAAAAVAPTLERLAADDANPRLARLASDALRSVASR